MSEASLLQGCGGGGCGGGGVGGGLVGALHPTSFLLVFAQAQRAGLGGRIIEI